MSALFTAGGGIYPLIQLPSLSRHKTVRRQATEPEVLSTRKAAVLSDSLKITFIGIMGKILNKFFYFQNINLAYPILCTT